MKSLETKARHLALDTHIHMKTNNAVANGIKPQPILLNSAHTPPTQCRVFLTKYGQWTVRSSTIMKTQKMLRTVLSHKQSNFLQLHVKSLKKEKKKQFKTNLPNEIQGSLNPACISNPSFCRATEFFAAFLCAYFKSSWQLLTCIKLETTSSNDAEHFSTSKWCLLDRRFKTKLCLW